MYFQKAEESQSLARQSRRHPDVGLREKGEFGRVLEPSKEYGAHQSRQGSLCHPALPNHGIDGTV
jgi:hypothetical protein